MMSLIRFRIINLKNDHSKNWTWPQKSMGFYFWKLSLDPKLKNLSFYPKKINSKPRDQEPTNIGWYQINKGVSYIAWRDFHRVIAIGCNFLHCKPCKLYYNTTTRKKWK
jgi:hypothetical protein